MITFGSSTLGIGLAIHLRDQFTTRSRAIQAEFQRLHGSAQRVMEDNLRATRRVGIAMMATGAIMTAGFGKGLRAAADFEYVMKTVELSSNATAKQLAQMEALSVKLGTSTIFKPQEVASAMEFLVKAGFHANEVINGTIQAVTYLGGALDKPIGGKGGVADYMSHIMQGYGIGPAGAGRVADMIVKTALRSSSDLEDIHEALKYVSSTTVDLGISLDETLAMIAKLSNAGLRGGIGGRSLNNMLIQLSTSLGQLRSPKHEKVLGILGISPKDLVNSKGELRKITEVLGVLDVALKRLPPIERVSALTALMNLRGARAVGPLLRPTQIGGSFSELLAEIRSSGNVAEDIAVKRMNTLWGSFERLGDVIWNFFKTIGTIIEPLFKPVLDMTIKVITKVTQMSQTWWGKPLVILAALSGLALTAMGGLLVMFTTIKLMTLASTVTFGNMGRTLVAAWTSSTAAALRYATVANGAMLVGTPTGARWRNMTTGKFQKGATGMTLMGIGGGGGWLKSIGNFFKGLTSASGALGVLSKVLKVVTGPIGWFVTILSALVGFRNILKLIVFGLGTLLNAIIFAGQAIWAVISNLTSPWNMGADLDVAKKRFSKAQDNMFSSLGLKESLNKDQTTFANPAAYNSKLIGWDDWAKNLKVNRGPAPIYLSGKKVGEITEEEKMKELRTLLATKPTN